MVFRILSPKVRLVENEKPPYVLKNIRVRGTSSWLFLINGLLLYNDIPIKMKWS
jgi:hypothetical protein